MPKVSILLQTDAHHGRDCSSFLTHQKSSLLQGPTEGLWREPFELLIIFALNDLPVLHTCLANLGAECTHGMTTPILTIAEFQLGCSLEFHLHFSIAQLVLKKSLKSKKDFYSVKQDLISVILELQ